VVSAAGGELKTKSALTAAQVREPWLVLPDALTELYADPEAATSRYRLDGTRRSYALADNGTAIIPVYGYLSNGSSWLGSDYPAIQAALAEAVADPEVSRIALDIDSPGGTAAGAFETAEAVRQAHAKKPVTAYAGDMATSAAYAIASGAGRIVIPPSGVLGSIGVVLLHLDRSRMLDEAGVTPSFIYAGAKKIDGNSLQPLSERARRDMQRDIDGLYDRFVDTVVAGRKRLTKTAIRATEAGVYRGREAIQAGLADDIGELSADLAKTGDGGVTMAVLTPNAGTAPEWVVGADEGLPIDMREAWDGPAAKARMLDAAGFGGSDPDPAKARRGFLVYDHHNASLKGSYEFPFADIIDGELKATSGGLRAAAARLPGSDLPAEAKTRARAVIDGYEKRIRDQKAEHSENQPMTTITQEQLDAAVAAAQKKGKEEAEAAAKADRDRSAAIAALPEAKGREPLAAAIAAQGLTIEAAKAVLAAAPKPSSLAARASAGVPDIGAGADDGAATDQAKVDAAWSAIVAKENKARGFAA
jgi:signal peptide peptidase SppA